MKGCFLLITTVTCSIGFALVSFASFEGRYCEMDGAYPDSGKSVYSDFYMYSDKYGETMALTLRMEKQYMENATDILEGIVRWMVPTLRVEKVFLENVIFTTT